jgi:glycosyltransferase
MYWIWVKMLFGHPASFVSRAAYKKYGLYDTSFKISADYELFLRFVRGKAKFSYIPIRLAYFRKGGISTSGEEEVNKEDFLVRAKHNKFNAYAIAVILRLLKWIKK